MLSCVHLFDSHAHLDDDQFNEDFEEVIEQITSSCVKFVVDVGASIESSEKAVKIAQKVPFVYAAVGLHPCDADQCTEEGMQKIRELAKYEKVVAIGESGLDYYWDDCPRNVQKMSFIKHIELANELDLPLIVHNRDAHGDTLSILKEHKPKNAIIHCFSGSAEMAEELCKMGYYISFSGSLTFKNAKNLPEALKKVPLDRLLVETDSPYLSPEPFRGKRNDPTRVEHTARKAAEILGISFEELCEKTFENTKRVYNLR
ncbi:MAG: TatD family hydrolase [Clostridia bacterium]|nr:TatD family hydrolase [Clostridia bacterium]